MLDIKKRQHYVWQYYFEPWVVDDKVFWMNRDDIIDSSKTKNISVENYFYKYDKLTSNELTFLQDLLSIPLNELAINWTNIMNIGFDLKDALSKANAPDNLDEIFKPFINNIGEEIQSYFENMGAKYLQMLRAEQTDFWGNEESNYEFTLYLTMQYHRTKNLRDKFLTSKDKFKNNETDEIEKTKIENCRFDEMWNYIFLDSATCTACKISVNMKDWELISLKNNTAIPFITSDQPVINLCAEHNKIAEKLIFYYPIKPNFAILIKEKTENHRPIINESDVLFYNDKIKYHSDINIYSNSRDINKFISECKNSDA